MPHPKERRSYAWPPRRKIRPLSATSVIRNEPLLLEEPVTRLEVLSNLAPQGRRALRDGCHNGEGGDIAAAGPASVQRYGRHDHAFALHGAAPALCRHIPQHPTAGDRHESC